MDEKQVLELLERITKRVSDRFRVSWAPSSEVAEAKEEVATVLYEEVKLELELLQTDDGH